ncbi:MAG TPA: XRE family transcriptional regulator [Chthoniobacteraceae bacterium]|jgi:Zn-dependent peptidase ImmA (M78 family)|nr:XRE family transcriptional regulator [Chthoniobacteraceae bacterium]
MPHRVPALVKPELLIWARDSAGYSSLDRVAELTGFDAMTLAEWENGHESPSLGELRKLGEVYKRPIAVFFLAEPPRKFDAQREFRRLPGIVPGAASPELLQALRWAVFRREAAMELHRLTGEPPPEVVAKLHPEMDREDAGRQIREFLGLSWGEQMQWGNPSEALRAWRTAIEEKGVLIFQTSDVQMEETRGTCIPDQPLPVVLLNGKDAPHGRIFSLLHEFAHILLHAGGHHTSRMVGERSPEEQPLEVAANAFAAAALLPEDEFRAVTASYRAARRGEDRDLQLMAQKLKVSPEAILRRMSSLGIATEALYRRKRTEWGAALWYVPAPAGGGGPPPSVKTIAKDGRGYTRLVLDAYDQRLITTSTASDYLGARPRHFPDIRRALSQRPELTDP